MSSPIKRFFYLDNIRIYLTILVILHHATLAYGGTGGWAIHDEITDDISPILFTFFNALNQSYFMTTFFLLAGYFTPRSLERKGSKNFLVDRLIRLGIPLLVYTTLIFNFNLWMINQFYLDRPYQYVWTYQPGHLWFLQLLFLFALFYVIYKLYKKGPSNLDERAFASDLMIWISVIVLAIFTFLMRLIYPIGETILNVQPGHITHYIFAFYAGIAAYHSDWFQQLTVAKGKRWGKIALREIAWPAPLVVATPRVGAFVVAAQIILGD